MSAPVKTFGQRMPEKPEDPLANLWRLKVNDALYGPYTGYQLRRFYAEGRLAAHSMVSREGATGADAQWHTAASDAVLGPLFRQSAEPIKLQPTFGQREGAARKRFVLVIDLKTRPTAELEAAIVAIGRAHRVASNVWLFSGAHTMTGLRNHLSQFLGQGDSMLLVDADQATASGYNLGPENDVLVRRVWNEGESAA
jgi:hypothetical protein